MDSLTKVSDAESSSRSWRHHGVGSSLLYQGYKGGWKVALSSVWYYEDGTDAVINMSTCNSITVTS